MTPMFGLFKKTSEIDKLQKKYEILMKEWHELSATNRAKSDKKFAEAQEVVKKIEQIQL